ncbi:hypothetical protein PROAA_1560008 [Candidatus Propionivibrio aalborgensis]|uniref:Uncharacterized protein n=1 Tax=Candidatus Propionivibrio aalborgensis TaxID=1860101 RepID=A0A1A8XNH6_9RHOO|nr:hypothetical protein PROAA_1560008 [Candidatus Propionivibrio aalborgensis]
MAGRAHALPGECPFCTRPAQLIVKSLATGFGKYGNPWDRLQDSSGVPSKHLLPVDDTTCDCVTYFLVNTPFSF